MRKTLLALALPFLLCTLAHAASFDCAKSKTAQEKAICATPDLSAADDQMAALYKAWLAAASPDWAAGIRDDQRIWLRTRTTGCQADDDSLVACLTGLYAARIDGLRKNVKTIAGARFVSRTLTLTAPDAPNSVPAGMSEITPGFGTLEATWPQVVSTSLQWTAWNKSVEAAAMQAVNLYNGDSQKPAQDWSKLVLPGIDDVVTVTVDGFNGKMISTTIENDYDGHGAHPTDNSSWFYWLLDEQRELKGDDVFQPNSGWDTWLEQQLDSYLHKALDADSNGNYQTWFPQGKVQKNLRDIVSNPEGWQLNARGLTLIFQPYEVACYACTPDPMTISWTDLKPYLQPNFVLPQ